MRIRLVNDLVLIKRTEGATKVGSIELAPTSVEELQEGTVIAVGPGKPTEVRVHEGPEGSLLRTEKRHWERRPMSVTVGDRVLFSEHGHQVVKIEGNFFVTLREDSIVGVIDGDEMIKAEHEPPKPDDDDEQEPDDDEDGLLTAGEKLMSEFVKA